MKTKTKHFKTSLIEVNEFKEIVEKFCSENGLSEFKVSGRKDVVFFSGDKSFLPILWDFSFEGTFSLHNSYGLISVEFTNVFDRIFNYLLCGIWILIFVFAFLNISLSDRALFLLTQAFWLIVVLLKIVLIFFQKKLLNSLCREIPGLTMSLKKKEFSKLLED